MSDYSNSKNAGSSAYPIKAIDAASVRRVEPLLTSDTFKLRYLWGIPHYSPITKEPLTPEMIQDYLNRAVNMVELDAQVDVFAVQRKIRLPFQVDLYREFIYTELPNKPIISVEQMAIVGSNGENIYSVPKEWIDTANYVDGRINVVPLSPAFNSLSTPGASGVGGAFLVLIGFQEWYPAYWQIEYTAGFCTDNRVPQFINELVGLKASIMIFNNLIPQFQLSSYSLGLDGISQSQTNQAPLLYAQIRDQYIAQYEALVTKVKMMYNNTMIVSFV